MPWKLIKDEKPDYGMNVLIETTDGWMHEAFRNIGNRGDFYRSGKFTMDESQIFAWSPLPADYHGSVPTNSENVDKVTEVAVLQVSSDPYHIGVSSWHIVGVFATKELAEQEASLRGYTRWSVSEFAVMGGDNA